MPLFRVYRAPSIPHSWVMSSVFAMICIGFCGIPVGDMPAVYSHHFRRGCNRKLAIIRVGGDWSALWDEVARQGKELRLFWRLE